MVFTQILIGAGLLVLGYMVWAALQELRRAVPAGGEEDARLLLGEEQRDARGALLELQLAEELGRARAEDGAEIRARLREELRQDEEYAARLAARRQAIEDELQRRLAAPDTGKSRETPRPPALEKKTRKPAADAEPRQGKCPSCSRPHSPGARFCQGCGKRLALSCPGCGTQLRDDALFCSRCGHRV